MVRYNATYAIPPTRTHATFGGEFGDTLVRWGRTCTGGYSNHQVGWRREGDHVSGSRVSIMLSMVHLSGSVGPGARNIGEPFLLRCALLQSSRWLPISGWFGGMLSRDNHPPFSYAQCPVLICFLLSLALLAPSLGSRNANLLSHYGLYSLTVRSV